jgi:4-hydroxybenzoate polyprenyltransferase
LNKIDASPRSPAEQEIGPRAPLEDLGADRDEAIADEAVPLCVDLDGTLVQTDTLYECVLAIVKTRPLSLLGSPFWLLQGRARLKERLYALARLGVDALPYRDPLVRFLREEAARGRSLVLATAAPENFALDVAKHLQCFSDVVATCNGNNLKGAVKAGVLQARFGSGGFDYVGDDWSDLVVWKAARKAIVATRSRRLLTRAHEEATVDKVFDTPRGGLRAYLRAMRLHQWAKNALIFLPLLAAHRILELPLLLSACLAFFAFGLVASGGYVVNDLLDLSADRDHPRKRTRPFSSGRVPLSHGFALSFALIVAGSALAAMISFPFFLWLLLYLGLTLTYSLWLKRKMLIDVFVLAALYTHRLIAGAIVTSIEPSFWLLAFSGFFFLSLAMLKRYSELVDLKLTSQTSAPGRGYTLGDLDTLVSLGTASGYASILVLALYVNSPVIARLYKTPQAIWLACPLLLYWLSRAWVGAGRGKIDDDPLVFALRDPVSRLVLALLAGLILFATFVQISCLPWIGGCT